MKLLYTINKHLCNRNKTYAISSATLIILSTGIPLGLVAITVLIAFAVWFRKKIKNKQPDGGSPAPGNQQQNGKDQPEPPENSKNTKKQGNVSDEPENTPENNNIYNEENNKNNREDGRDDVLTKFHSYNKTNKNISNTNNINLNNGKMANQLKGI